MECVVNQMLQQKMQTASQANALARPGMVTNPSRLSVIYPAALRAVSNNA